MARSLRIQYPGAYYHVTSRGNEQKDVFKSRKDRERFLSYLESATERYGARIHCYCLMSNHYHLFMETPEGNLSQIMRHINGAYTTYFNVKRRRAGHLFQGRYKAILVEVDRHAKELSRYIHLNPVRADMVARPEEHAWSSYRALVGQGATPKWLRRDLILGYFGPNLTSAQQRYRNFVEDLLGEAYESPLKRAVGGILGPPGFIEEVTARHLQGKAVDREVPALRELVARPSPEQIVRAVEAVIGDDAKQARRASIYFFHRFSGLKLRDLGAFFNVRESAISEASRRFSLKLQSDESLRDVVGKIREVLKV